MENDKLLRSLRSSGGVSSDFKEAPTTDPKNPRDMVKL